MLFFIGRGESEATATAWVESKETNDGTGSPHATHLLPVLGFFGYYTIHLVYI